MQNARDKEKETVSDFLLGKTEKKDLTFDETNYEKDITEKLDMLIELIGSKENDN